MPMPIWLRAALRAPARVFIPDATIEPPLRAELFSADQMEEHGSALAAFHRVQHGPAPNRLLPRLAENAAVLVDTCALITAAIREGRRVTPASEWLLDNYYLVDEHVRTARRHFPKEYNRQLPRLTNGVSADLPRIYDIALNAISHGDGRFDPESLHRFVAAYQRVVPLTLGELWAIPIMLRLALIENLRRVATRVAQDRRDRNLAADWGERMADIVAHDPKSLILAVADMARSDPPASASFVAELMQRLLGQSASLALPVSWLAQRLAEDGVTIEQLVQSEHQQQAADQMSVSNSIGSLRLLLSTDWRSFVEGLSDIEAILATDPAQVYARMDFATRDDYRHVVERLARKAGKPEAAVAGLAVTLAAAAIAGTPQAHVGYYLVGAGRAALQQGCGLRPTLRQLPVPAYLGAVVLLTAILAGAAAAWLPLPAALMACCAVVALLALVASQLSVTLVNWLAAHLVAPQALPRMDYSLGLPPDAATLIVVPTLLASAGSAQGDVDDLEIRYLANRQANLYFALLTDFPDAASEHCADDAEVLAAAVAGIERLNQLYADAGDTVFYLLHRPRRWNAGEAVWMGEERKRGKLGDLNALLRGRGAGRFSHISGAVERLRGVRYVITLDADTRLPHDAAQELVATLHHPLNHAQFDPHSERVVAGYGILQPRVGTTLPPAGVSPYAALFGGDLGLDPYTRAVSDTYQDLFGEGSFTGKGIYDVDAFERALDGRMPHNRVLSHDLLEGCYARSGLASDLAVFESFPQSYAADMKRRQRWIRGDWQLTPWLWPRVPLADGSRQANPLPALARWKIFDNLRRSLVAPALFALLLLAWTTLAAPVRWTACLMFLALLPAVVETVLATARKSADASWRQHLRLALHNGARRFGQTAFTLLCLPYEAAVSLDAILRTLWRCHVSRRRLLEWVPSSAVERRGSDSFGSFLRRMSVAPAAAVLAGAVIVLQQPAALPAALPFLALWLAAPLAAWRASRVPRQADTQLDARHIAPLREVARRTWRYFEHFVDADSHWLAPDNFQEQPGGVVAQRTSPTNIGLGLLATLAAHDFGYLARRRLIERLEAAFDALDRLERYRGHLYNWYDTRTLMPLQPRYVSTVDSGNFAGHLLTLRQGLLALADAPSVPQQMLRGAIDTATVLQRLLPAPAQSVLAHCIAAGAAAVDNGAMRSALQSLGAEAQALAIATTDAEPVNWARSLALQCADAVAELDAGPVADQADRLRLLAARAAQFAVLDYEFLYDRTRDLFCIGFNVSDHRRDSGYYDLLASEARLGIFVAIAQGCIPVRGWFSLGRLLMQTGGTPVLLSWSGSMFEYLMPNLVMPAYPGSLLAHTARAAVARQIAYGHERGVPWGISECGYNLTDAANNYQYRAFGVPGLGLQRGLAQELVIAPYASALALLATPDAAAANLQRLRELGWLGIYGYYEAIDYTAARLPPGQSQAVVRSYMAHHQGMTLLAVAHVLLDRPMQRRFEADPQVQSALLLLQERVPRASGQPASDPRLVDVREPADTPSVPLRVFDRPDPDSPAVQLLSNGRYQVMLTSAGGGYSRWRDIALTRWREDPTRDAWGCYAYLRDVNSGQVWSTAFQPTLQAGETYTATFTEACVEFRRRQGGWETHTEIVVSPEDDIELRRTRITNLSATERVLEITSYAEVVLAPAIADSLHPAFSKLFVQTEIVAARNAILCSRRPRDPRDTPPWLVHLLVVREGESLDVSYETDRARFIGRRRDTTSPAALDRDAVLSGTDGPVLDPIVAIRHRIRLAPEATAQIDLVIGVGTNREHCLQLADKYHDRRLADRVVDLAWTHSQMSLRQLNISEAQAQTYARLAGRLLYSHPSLRADAQLVLRNRRGQPGLWAHAISGDLPILLVQISDIANLELAREAVQAHAYLRMKGLAADLVIWNEERAGYRQDLRDALMGMVAASVESSLLERPGGIFLRAGEQISHEDRLLLLAVARIVFDDRKGGLGEHLRRRPPAEAFGPRRAPPEAERGTAPACAPAAEPVLALYNGHGGYSADAREYVIVSRPGEATPMPWANVIANADFGCVVSEAGTGYTWRSNAHEYRLTPWHNDPLSDAAGEAFYVRDEDSGRYWSPTLLPARGTGNYITRHGFGYSVFEHAEDGILTELRVYVAADAAVKFFVLRVRNASGRRRALSVTGYVEWVLGDLAPKSAMHVVTELDPHSGALFARNPFHPEFGDWVSFFDVDEAARTLTGDRLEFIGRNGNLARPAAMERARLSGRVGALMDPCGAIQIPLDLADGQSRELIFRLGTAASAEAANALVLRLRSTGFARSAFSAVASQWRQLLGAVEVQTPDPALDALANGWLIYQVVACRLWGRSGYYQSGGAFGFRDQLQDAMALVHAAPELLRAQLLLCATRQFKEGDVQHWWHPPSGRGVRTRCSDDYLWLPLATCRYIACSGDAAVLDATETLLDGRALNHDEESYYDLPLRWDTRLTLYDHCVRAIEHGLRFGAHGLPLIGSGDWNDGMNHVGPDGRGESVWLGFFLHRVLLDFAPLALARGDTAFAARCGDNAARLRDSLETGGWDGAWYRRAYFDDGTPLGAAENVECRIDSIAQSWAVLSGAAPDERIAQALDALQTHLVRPQAQLVQLLDPPFDGAGADPGYIRGYLPGVRENGGQYTHAAIWAAMAQVQAGRTEAAWQLYDMINPVRHALTRAGVDTYQVEPYVIAADVYAVAPHTGRGGWTWYTGSAGWMYRLTVESLLGIRREADTLRIDPRLPAHWPGFRCTYRYGNSVYRIHVVVARDRAFIAGGTTLPLVDDGAEHRVDIVVGGAVAAAATDARIDTAT
jgi:cyclic beta-1,2-glucan synthetase